MKKIEFLFRFPIENEQNKLWIDAVNKVNDEHHKSTGNGWLCEEHFSSADCQNVKGQIKLKSGAIPDHFKSAENQFVISESHSFAPCDVQTTLMDNDQSLQYECNKCDILQMELRQLKQLTFKTQVDLDLEIQKKTNQIEKLLCKCGDQSLVIRSLKERIIHLETLVKENTSEIKILQEQINRLPEINVNFNFIYLYFRKMNAN